MIEVNFDGLVGLTHNYAGLSYGNVASASNKGLAANPRGGALEGVAKMRTLMGLGMTQGVLPPHARPHLPVLHGLGYRGTDADIIAKAYADNPVLMANLASASPMWTANAATVTPRSDSQKGTTQFTPANLAAMYHRSTEVDTTSAILAKIFPQGDRFGHNPALDGGTHFGDEGAANHNRLCADYNEEGVALFVYGRPAFDQAADLTYPGRQTKEASQAIARQHATRENRTVFWRQSPDAINAGAFHNDVVAVANRQAFFYHEKAFDQPDALEEALKKAADGLFDPQFVRVPDGAVPLKDAVKSYLFNSQLISRPGEDRMTLILPQEVAETPSTKAYVEELVSANGPIGEALTVDVRQSMRNGGGPACLRLRVVLDEADRAALGARVIMTEERLAALEVWIRQHYRDRLLPEDLGDPKLWNETMTALDALSQLLDLGAIYPFQR